jgi:hypothetical protein
MTSTGRKVLLFIAFLASLSMPAQTQGHPAAQKTEFRLDLSKPYVYLEVDHIGPRTPLRESEPREGIWLRLRNNCDVPIVVVTFGHPPGKPEAALGVVDEVVPNAPDAGPESAGSGIGYSPEQKDLTDIFLSPDQNEAEIKGVEDSLKGVSEGKESASRPHGYNGGYQPGFQVLTVIPPGVAVPFSVPISHVSKTWHFEVPFRFALKHEGAIRQPYSYVAFFWDDLPESYRATNSEPAALKPSSPGSTLLHESSHVDLPKQQ